MPHRITGPPNQQFLAKIDRNDYIKISCKDLGLNCLSYNKFKTDWVIFPKNFPIPHARVCVYIYIMSTSNTILQDSRPSMNNNWKVAYLTLLWARRIKLLKYSFGDSYPGQCGYHWYPKLIYGRRSHVYKEYINLVVKQCGIFQQERRTLKKDFRQPNSTSVPLF